MSVSSQVVAPGDIIMAVPETGVLKLGPGVSTQEGIVSSTKSGAVRHVPKSGLVCVEGRQKRYIPSEMDNVVGTIVDRHAENFVVEIGAPFFALLPQLSFEGATRRNRPNLKAGDVVYARVISASKDMEPQLSCTDTSGRASGFGHLKEGITVQVSTAMARRMLTLPLPAVLDAMQSHSSLQFELAVGMNGRVWLASPSIQTTILVADVLQKAEFLTDTQVRTLVSRVVAAVAAEG